MFVGVLAASNHTFVDLTRTRSLPDWTASHVRMFEFWGGVPELVIPDNEKAAVRQAEPVRARREPDVPRPGGPLRGRRCCPPGRDRPRDKAKVGGGSAQPGVVLGYHPAAGPEKWQYFYLYVILDIYSRYAAGWMVAERETAGLAGHLIGETCLKHRVQPRVLTLHSDRGAPMTAKCTAQLLADLGVTQSLGRPGSRTTVPTRKRSSRP